MTILEGQHALITGGGSGIGLGCARALLADGASVTLMGRSRERLEAAAHALADVGEVSIVTGDVASEESVSAAVAYAQSIAPLTIAIANAGTGGAAPFFATDDASWQTILQTNLTGTFYTLKHAGQAIAAAGGGAMCAISSIAGLRTHPLMAAYTTSKAGIDMLVRNTADELGAVGIRVNSVCPGLVDTELAAGLIGHPAMVADYRSCMPLDRVGQPQDIGAAVRFLCGPESSWITGVSLPVDGGHHLRRGPNLGVMMT